MKAWIDHQTYSIKPTDSWRIQNAKKAGHAEDYTLEQIAEAIGRGQTVTPAAYHTIPNPTEKNPDAVSFVCDEKQLFFLDFDEGDTFPSKSAFQRCAEKGIFPAFWYRSFSSTEQKEKYRLCFLCDEPITDEGKAHRIQRGLMEIFPQSDRACKDLCRLFYGTNKGVFILDGAPSFSYADICQITPEQPRTQSAPPRLNYAAQPGNWLQENISDILAHISPDCCYADWLRVGAALHYEGFPFSIFDSWSRGGSKYKIGEPEKKWNSFRDSGSALVTGATLTAMAKENGWRKPERVNSYQKPAGSHQSDYKPQGSTYTPEAVEAPQEAQGAEQKRLSGAEMIDLFLNETTSRRYAPISTGLQTMDRILDGGFMRQTIIFLGAAPGTGKTALATMIFEAMAKQGKQCLYLNLEMSRNQLLARSLSRIIYQQENITMKATSILRGYQLTEQQKSMVNMAAKIYKEDVSDFMIYNPEGLKPDLDTILGLMEKEAQAAEAQGDTAPIVCVDYLQLITGRDREDGATVVKRAVAEFKEYARKHNSIVFVIMAQSRRANKSSEADMAAGRDTSAIEYSADIQLQLIKDEQTQMVTLYVTKNRFGEADAKRGHDFHFNGAASLFCPVEQFREEPTWGGLSRITRATQEEIDLLP